MPNCEICGRTVPLFKTEIEGTELTVCEHCSKFGTVLGKVSLNTAGSNPSTVKQRIIVPEIEEDIVTDFSDLIRVAREKKGLNQEDFSKLLNERESLVQKWETGLLKPKIEIARKLERLLGIHLVEVREDKKVKLENITSNQYTLGDMIKIKKRKN